MALKYTDETSACLELLGKQTSDIQSSSTFYEKGICFVFDHQKFKGNLFPNRNGSQYERVKIKEVFESANIEVRDFVDESKQNLLRIIDDFNGTNIDFDCIIIILLTYGSGNNIAAFDQIYNLEEITATLECFEGPKFILIDSSGPLSFSEGEINFYNCTVAAYSKSRVENLGESRVIQCLVDVIKEVYVNRNQKLDFDCVIALVNRRVEVFNYRVSVVNTGSLSSQIININPRELLKGLQHCELELFRILQNFEYNLLTTQEVTALKGKEVKPPKFLTSLRESLLRQIRFVDTSKAEIVRVDKNDVPAAVFDHLEQLHHQTTTLINMWHISLFAKTTKICCLCIDNLECFEGTDKELVSLETDGNNWRRVIRKCINKNHLRANEIIPNIRTLVNVYRREHPSDLVPQDLEINIYAHCGIQCIDDRTKKNYIFGIDGSKLELETLLELLCTFKYFKSILVNLNCCIDYIRPNQEEYTISCDSGRTTKIIKDILIGWSTLGEHKSWRSAKFGSHFIRQLCEKIRNYYSSESLLKIVRRIETEIEKDEKTKYIQVTEFKSIGFERKFKLYSVRKGKCVIINIKNFVRNKYPTRRGSEKDVEALNQLFTMLKFKVEIHGDVTEREMVDIIERARTATCDTFALFVMSHGIKSSGKNYIVTNDGKWVPTDEIIEMFNEEDCVQLIGIPKLLFFNACRGEKMTVDSGEVKDNDDDKKVRNLRDASHPRFNASLSYPMRDLLIVWSTIAGYDNAYYSSDSRKSGRLIDALHIACKTVDHICGGVRDFLDIMDIVQFNLRTDHEAKFEQQIEVNSIGFSKLLDFGFNTTPENSNDYYDIRSEGNGYCLVIANEYSESGDEMIRYHYDEKLRDISQILGFTYVIKTNLTAKEIFSTVNEYARNEEVINHKAFMLFLLTDGKRVGSVDFLIGYDGVHIAIDKIKYIFNERNAPFLVGKPKLIFTSAPRGGLITLIKIFMNLPFPDKYYVKSNDDEVKRYKQIDVICDKSIKFQRLPENPNISLQLNTPFGLIIKVGSHYINYGSSAKLTLPLAFKKRSDDIPPLETSDKEKTVNINEEIVPELHIINDVIDFSNEDKLDNILWRTEAGISTLLFQVNRERDRDFNPSEANMNNTCFCGHYPLRRQ